MCRHLAYLGPPRALADLLCAPPFALLRQAWAPRRQRHGTVNADGFGVGWYAAGDPVPARYRRAIPIWADPSFADLARVTRTTALLAAVRSATPGTAPDESAAAPFAAGGWLFSHNGRVDGWPESIEPLAALLPRAALLRLESHSDSSVIWAIVINAIGAGADPATALAATVAEIAELTSARLNLLLTDGQRILATAYSDTLCWRPLDDGSGVVVASEPYDDDPGWLDVPDRSLLVATADHVDVRPLTS